MKETDVLYRAVPSSRPWARALASILVGCVTLASSRAHGQPLDPVSTASLDRAQTMFRSALQLGTEWFGPIVSADQSRNFAADGLSLIPDDPSLERAAIADAIGRFWAHQPTPLTPFEEGVSAYTSIRAIHELLAARNVATVRLFGDSVPFPIRSMPLSPTPADSRPAFMRFDELPMGAEVIRVVKALQTIERFVGWPAMAQALKALRASEANTIDAGRLAATLSTIRGADASRLVRECLRPDAVFDYAIERVQSSASPAGTYESTITIARLGSGVLVPAGDDDPERALPLLVRFADGRELREWLDGAAPATTVVYTSQAPVSYAAVDPEAMLLLDVERQNNSFSSTRPLQPLAVRLALQWMSWLQLTMLTYTALA